MYQRSDFGTGPGQAATAVLSLDRALPLPGRGFGSRAEPERRISDLAARIAEIDWVPDLGARIGSRDWWRGLATCTALCASAVALSPGVRPIEGATPAPLAPAEWEEARAQTITPLAWGGDTGKHMAATDAVVALADTPERPSVDLTATLGQGDGFRRVLERAGIGSAEAGGVADMVARAVALDAIKPGTVMGITLGRRPNRKVARPLDKLAFRAAFDLSLAVERIGANLQLRRIPIAVDDTPLRIQGRVGSSLYRSARAAGVPAKAVEGLIRALAGRMSIGRDVQADNRFDVIVEHRRAATGEVEIGKLLFAGLDQGKRQTRLMQWTTGGRTEWYEAAGVGVKRGVLSAPVAGGRQTSGYGMRMHPLLGYSRFHKGIDFGAPYGAPIHAATDGVVVFAGRHGGHGNFVKLNHAGGLGTGYAHMSRFAVSAGQRVAQGQIIGYVGSTGLSTGPHLHYELYKNGVAVDPRSISFTMTSQLVGADLVNFRSRLAHLLAVRPGAANAPVRVAAR